jgi:hypothetical protein
MLQALAREAVAPIAVGAPQAFRRLRIQRSGGLLPVKSRSSQLAVSRPVAHIYQPIDKFCLTPQAPPLP